VSEALKVLNNIEQLYQQPVIKTNEGWQCPVCGKGYKSEKRAKTHVDKQDCVTYQSLLKDTLLEIKVFSVYKLIIAAYSPAAKVSLQSFRKSRYYKAVSKFVMFCHLHEIKDVIKYLEWINWEKDIHHMNALLSNGVKESVLREYRMHCQVIDDIDSDAFYERNEKALKQDPQFLVRSIEKALISITYLAYKENFNFENTMESLPIDYKNRVKEIIEYVIRNRQ